MQIYVHRNNQQLGPFTEAEIKAQLAAGTISLQDHVWWQGQDGWKPLSQTSLVAATPPVAPVAGGTAPVPISTAPSSSLAVWSLVLGCFSFTCCIFTGIPAIILGHISLSQIKKNPGMQGRGLALGGTILGYVFSIFYVITYVIMLGLGHQLQDTFKTIDAQLKAAQAAQATNSDESTNSPDSTTPTATPTNTPDQSTNSDSTTNAPPSDTNSDSTTNAPPASQ